MGADKRMSMRHLATCAAFALCVVFLGNASSTEEGADAITEVFDKAPEQYLIDREELIQRRSPYLKYVMNNYLNKSERKRALQIEKEVDQVRARHVQAKMEALETAKNSLGKAKKGVLKKVKKLAKKMAALKKARKVAKLKKQKKKAMKEADKSEESWVHKEKSFRKEARTLNKDQRWFARKIEKRVKVMQKWHVKTTADDLEHMRQLAKDETKNIAQEEKFKQKMEKIQHDMAHENAKAKEIAAKRLTKYKAEVAADAKKIAQLRAEH